MSEDLEKAKSKGKKPRKRRRSLRAYVNMNEPVNQDAAALIGQFPPDADDDADAGRCETPDAMKRNIDTATRRRLAAEGKALPNLSYPIENEEDLHNAAHLARTGHGDVAAARRLIARRAKELGVANPLEGSQKAVEAAGSYTFPGGRNPADRLSPSRVTGQASPSTGDHNTGVDPMAVPGARELAFRHPASRTPAGTTMDLGTHTPFPLMTMRTVQGDNQYGDRDITYTAGQVGISRLDAAGATGLHAPAGNPVSRPLDHIAQNAATPPNGGHSLAGPQSRAPQAMKNSELRAEFKRMLFPGSGGGR